MCYMWYIIRLHQVILQQLLNTVERVQFCGHSSCQCFYFRNECITQRQTERQIEQTTKYENTKTKKSLNDKPSICPLFLSRQYPWSVDDGDALQHWVRHVRTLEPVQECVSELRQRTKLFLWVNDECVAWNDAFRVTVHHSYETIGRRLRTNPQTWKILHHKNSNYTKRYNLILYCRDK